MDDNIDYNEYQPGHYHLRLCINKYENNDACSDVIHLEETSGKQDDW